MSAATPADVAIPDLDADARTNAAWHTKFSRDEIQELVRVESWRGWLSIALDWAVIAASGVLTWLLEQPVAD